MKKWIISILALLSLLFIVNYSFNVIKTVNRNKAGVFCKKHGEEYTVSYINQYGRLKHKEDFPKEPSIVRHPNNLVEVSIGLGTSNTYSTFIDTKNDRISTQAFSSVIAFDPYRYLVAKAGIGGVFIYSIFDSKKELMKIKREFAPTAVLMDVVVEAKFLKGNKFYLKYMYGKNYDEKVETIDLTF